MLQVLIDSGAGYVDYSKYVIDDSISVTQTINQPTTIDLKFCNFDDQFVVPTRSSYIRLYSTNNSIVLATGFLTQDPEIEWISQVHGKNLLSYRIVATSDEWILNKKPIPFIPAFVNQTMGSILRTLAEALTPGFFTYQIDAGDIVPYFAYDPKKSWTEIAKSFYDSIRYHYYAVDKVLYFKPLGDLNLGLKYDDSPKSPVGTRDTTRYFSPELLKTQLQPITVVNDAIVIGDIEPQNYVEENFIGDGLTSDFSLKTKMFRGASSLLLQEDWASASFNKNLWTTLDTTGKFALAGTLNLLAGTGPSTLGTAYILGNNGLELGGHLNIQAGQVEFNSTASRGIIGGVYSSSSLTLANCSVGFMVSGGNIRPVVNGVPQAPLATIVASTLSLSKQYVLQTLISSNQWSRYNRVFSTLAGAAYGGTQVTAKTDITFIIQDVSLPAPTVTNPAPRATTVTNQVGVKGVTLPAFGVFAPVNSVDLQATVAATLISQPPQAKLTVQSLYGASGTNLPVSPSGLSIEQNYMIGFGMAGQVATVQSTSDVQLLSFYDDTIPSAGARIKLKYWEAGAAIGRVRNQALITAERKITGDDGVRTAIVSDLNPLPRTSAECELAGAAYIADRSQTQYNGSYQVQSDFWKINAAGVTGNTDYPRPGRFFNIHSPMRNITHRDFLVQSVTTTVDEQVVEQAVFSINFGPDLYINKLLPSFIKTIGSSILRPEDTAVDPTPQQIADIGTTYIGDFADATITRITGTTATFDLGAVPVSGAEVRLIDGGWGVDDGNRLLLTTAQTFTLARTALDETYYIRQINGPKTSRFTSVLRVVYPLVPATPAGSIDVRDWLKPVVQTTLTGDIRNICGIEVRSCMTPSASGNASASGSIAANLEQPFECLDFELIADDPSVNATVAIGSQNYTATNRKMFSRSEFLFNPSSFAPGTQFLFEAEVTNAGYRDVPAREIYIEKQMRGRTNPNPTIVHTLSVPPGSHHKRIRFTAPFVGYQYETLNPSVEGPSVTGAIDYTDAYRVWMQAEAPPVEAYPASTTIFPSAPFELHSLRLISQSQSAQKTAVEIPLSVASSSVSGNVDVGASSFSTLSTTFVDVDTATIWKYNSAEWGTINAIKFQATLSCPQSTSGGIVTAGLYDIERAVVVQTVAMPIETYPSQAVTLQTSFSASGSLIDGHTYTVQLKVTAPATTGHFYKARLLIVIDPLSKLNVYWRYANGDGTSTPIRTTDDASFALDAGCLPSRMIYDPEGSAPITGMFVEVTGRSGGSTESATDNFNRADGSLGANWTLAAGSDAQIISNTFSIKNIGTGGHAEYNPSSSNLLSGSVTATWIGYTTTTFGGPCCLRTTNGINSDYYCAEAVDNGGAEPRAQIRIVRRQGGATSILASSAAIQLGSNVNGAPIKLEWDVQPTQVVLNAYVNAVLVATATDSSGGRLTTGKVGLAFLQFTGTSFNSWDDWSYSASGTADSTSAMVDAGLSDGASIVLPGWFGYFDASHNWLPAQNYTVDPNMAAFVTAIVNNADPDIDDYIQEMVGIIFSAWQFQLFAATGGAGAAAGVVTINALRNTIIAGVQTFITALNAMTTNWVLATLVTLSGTTKQVARTVLSSTLQLTSGNRYFGSASAGVLQGLLAFQITGVASSNLDSSDIIPVPQYPTALLQRRFFAPSDLNYIFDNDPYRIREICFRVAFFNLMWEYSPELELTDSLVAPPTPRIEVISVLSIDIQVRLDLVGVEDTVSVTVEMSPTSQFIGPLVRVTGGPLQSVYSLHVPTGPNTPVVGQYLRARRNDYLGSSDWSETVFVSAASIKNSSFSSALGETTIVSSPLSNLFRYISDGTTITWTWDTFILTYSDGFIQYVNSGTQTFTGLANNTAYKFYPYLQGVRQASSSVIILKSTVSSGTVDDPAQAAQTSTDGRTALSRGSMTAATTAGVLGSGSGGGIG